MSAGPQTVDYRRALEALRNGVPNADAVRVLGSNQENVEQHFLERLASMEEAVAGERQVRGLLVEGGFGTGKSHLLKYLQDKAVFRRTSSAATSSSVRRRRYSILRKSIGQRSKLPSSRVRGGRLSRRSPLACARTRLLMRNFTSGPIVTTQAWAGYSSLLCFFMSVSTTSRSLSRRYGNSGLETSCQSPACDRV